MSTDIVQPFDFKGYKVRTLTFETGQTWWVLKDVCEVLGLSNPSRVAQRLDGDEVSKFDPNSGLGSRSNEPVNIINESGLYKIVLRSDKPEAREFQRWVTHDVLPQIRRTGGYIPVAEQDDEKVILSKAVLILNRTLGEKDRLLADRQKTIDRQRPLAALGESFLSVDGTMTITKAARHFQTIDRTMTRDMVFGLLRGAGYLEQAGNAPTVKAIRPGYLKQKVAKRRDGRMGRPYAVFTPKGINWFIRRFIYAEGQGQFDMEVAA